MKLSEIIKEIGLEVKTTQGSLDVEIKKGYSSDLLSDVMGNAHEEGLWVTLQTHNNIVAVAVLRSLAGIILVNNRQPDEDTLNKANEEGIPILQTSLSTFAVIGKLYELGITG